jgi:hypothetical protein
MHDQRSCGGSTVRRSSTERAWLCAVLVWLPAAGAYAQDVEAIIAEGVALRREGRDEDAADRFRAAHELGGGARALAHLGHAEQALGRWIDAEAHLTRALESREEWITRHAITLRESLEVVRRNLGDVLVEGNVEGARVLVNGRDVGTLPIVDPVRAEVGSIVVEARADGHFTAQRPVEVVAGETVRVQLTMIERTPPIEIAPVAAVALDPPRRQAPTPEIHASPEGDYWWGAGVTALALSALSAIATGIALHIRELNAVYWNTECPVHDRLSTCQSEWDTIHGAEIAAFAFGISAVATGGAGLGLTLFAAERF